MSRSSLFLMALVAFAPLAACDEEEACEDGVYSCQDDMLMLCVDGVVEEEEDCAADGMVCHAEGEHCMEAGEM